MSYTRLLPLCIYNDAEIILKNPPTQSFVNHPTLSRLPTDTNVDTHACQDKKKISNQKTSLWLSQQAKFVEAAQSPATYINPPIILKKSK